MTLYEILLITGFSFILACLLEFTCIWRFNALMSKRSIVIPTILQYILHLACFVCLPAFFIFWGIFEFFGSEYAKRRKQAEREEIEEQRAWARENQDYIMQDGDLKPYDVSSYYRDGYIDGKNDGINHGYQMGVKTIVDSMDETYREEWIKENKEIWENISEH